MTHTLHPLAEEYLDRLYRRAAHLPGDRREELVDEIEDHLLDALGEDASESDVRNVLDRLGTPEQIADAEQPAPPADAPRAPMGAQEWTAVLLLPLGGFILGVGWVAGVIMLWGSRAWSTLDKLIGTLLIPGGIATGVVAWNRWMAGVNACEYPLFDCEEPIITVEEAILSAVTIIPIVTAIYLARRANVTR